MKKIALCLLFVTVSLNFCYPQNNSNWSFSNPNSFGADFIDMEFINDNTGYAVSQGHILKSTDSGVNWKIYKNLNLPKNVIPMTIYIFNDSIIYIGCNMGYILKYFNNKIIILNRNNFNFDEFRTIKFLNYNTGFAGSNLYLYKTTDAGESWIKVDSLIINDIFKIKFLNETTGFLTSELGTIYKTTDAGITWLMNKFPNNYENVKDICMINENTGIACGTYGLILKTIDGGNSWFEINSGFSDQFFSVNFFDENNGVMVSNEDWYYLNSKIFITTNGGDSWIKLNSIDKMLFKCVEKLNTKIILGGKVGFLAEVNRQFQYNQITNYQIPLNTFIKGIKFFNENTGYLVTDTGHIYKSINKGNSWNKISDAPENLSILSFDFINEMTGFVIGKNENSVNLIYRTTNLGKNWILDPVNINNSISQLNFLNEQTGYLTTQNGLYKTENSGLNWTLKNNSSFVTRELKFTSLDTGYCIKGTSLMKTINGGLNWQTLLQQPSGIFLMSFLNSLTGYLFFDNFNNRYLFKTTNGGINWSYESFYDKVEYVSDFYFVNETSGYILSDKVYKIENSGETITPIHLTQNFRINDLYFYNEKLGFFYNHTYGELKAPIMLSSSIDGNVFVENSSSIIKSYSLHQNYPNPFNPNTTIKYNLVNSGLVKLKVFDVLGREVRTLVNDFKSAGTHSVEFNASNLSSGIYFYQMSVNEDISNSNKFFEVKKMILIK
ncbi:MAG: T9SS type A sorting domain-containing protein [Ignavibacteria bacterium]|nr:T9SS type A sorting domain-containing protein [Ignavibacteria bacterium]